jgi:hypothetical protein
MSQKDKGPNPPTDDEIFAAWVNTWIPRLREEYAAAVKALGDTDLVVSLIEEDAEGWREGGDPQNDVYEEMARDAEANGKSTMISAAPRSHFADLWERAGLGEPAPLGQFHVVAIRGQLIRKVTLSVLPDEPPRNPAPEEVARVLDAAVSQSADCYRESCQQWGTDDVVVFVNQDCDKPDQPPAIFAAPREYVLRRRDNASFADPEEAETYAKMAGVYDNLVEKAERGTFWIIFAVNGKFGLTSQLIES